MQFGAKPLFENISVKFGGGNRYGLIGANGCGKSTFMKILGGELEPSAGNVSLEPNIRLGKLRQDQFAYEDVRVLDVVMMGHDEMWQAAAQRDAIYANPDANDEDYMRAAELEAKYAEYGGYTAEAKAGELLLGIGIPLDQHNGPMSNIAPGWKLRVLLAQALFSDPDVLLLDEPTNNLDIHSIHWLEDVLNQRNSTMIIISHDRHFLNEVCTHMADMDFGTLKVYPGNYDSYMLASTQARAQQLASNAKAKEKKHFVDTKPDVCWQLPLRRSFETREVGEREYSITVIGEYERLAWGDGGDDFDWYCTSNTDAHVGSEPVYISNRTELQALMGEAAYAVLAEHCDKRVKGINDAKARSLPLFVIQHPASVAAGK